MKQDWLRPVSRSVQTIENNFGEICQNSETKIITKKSINVLCVIFDSKLMWSEHIASVIAKSKRSLNSLKIIRKCFSTDELIKSVTSNFFQFLI